MYGHFGGSPILMVLFFVALLAVAMSGKKA
jgi:hypothetical protein